MKTFWILVMTLVLFGVNFLWMMIVVGEILKTIFPRMKRADWLIMAIVAIVAGFVTYLALFQSGSESFYPYDCYKTHWQDNCR